MMSISSWFVVIRASGTLTIERPVCCASALISDVFPVPGGPWRRSPNLCGYPCTAYLPVRFTKCLSSARSFSFSSKKSEPNCFSSESLYLLNTRVAAPSSSLDDFEFGLSCISYR